MRPVPRVATVCANCGRTFLHYASQPRLFCSAACSQQWRKGKTYTKSAAAPRNLAILKTCAICGKAFAALPGKTTCSRQCAASLRKRERMPRLDPEVEALHAYVAKHYPSY